jgi:hypothetical protein
VLAILALRPLTATLDAQRESHHRPKEGIMKSSAYLYKLLGNQGVVRRDLPQAAPVPSLATPIDTVEAEALAARIHSSARNFSLLATLRPPQPQQPKLVSSGEGSIKSMLLTIPAGNTDGEFAAIYEALLQTLPAGVKFVCLVNTASRSAVEAWLQTYGRATSADVVEAPDHVGFSLWAQDAYAVSTTSANETFFVEPLSFLRYADAVISDYITTATTLRNFQTPLYFQGGNILIGDDFWLIGVDYPTKTLQYVENAILPNPGETPEQLVRRLFSDYLDVQRTLHYVGSTVPVPSEDIVLAKEGGRYFVDLVYQGNHEGTAQPLFHIDMFLTPAGRGPSGRYRLLVGDPSLGPAAPSPSATGYNMQRVYDAIAKSLETRFEILRNPLPLTFHSEKIPVSALNQPQDPDLYAIYEELTNAGLSEVDLRSWYFATANNALVQNDPADRRVWLPTYGHGATYTYLQASDKVNRQLWESLGYRVTELPSFHRLARGLGAVHCIQKYLARG